MGRRKWAGTYCVAARLLPLSLGERQQIAVAYILFISLGLEMRHARNGANLSERMGVDMTGDASKTTTQYTVRFVSHHATSDFLVNGEVFCNVPTVVLPTLERDVENLATPCDRIT